MFSVTMSCTWFDVVVHDGMQTLLSEFGNFWDGSVVVITITRSLFLQCS